MHRGIETEADSTSARVAFKLFIVSVSIKLPSPGAPSGTFSSHFTFTLAIVLTLPPSEIS
jgi:hypothetical protein